MKTIIINKFNNKKINKDIDIDLLSEMILHNYDKDFAYSDNNTILKISDKYTIKIVDDTDMEEEFMLYSPAIIVRDGQITIECQYMIITEFLHDTIVETSNKLVGRR